jgi:hypothetical protein
MAALAAIGGLATLYGGYQEYNATKQEGKLAQMSAELQAKQTEDAAVAEKGMAAMNAKEQRRQGRLLQSKAIAAAAASGRAPSADKGAADIIGNINKETEYGALTSLLEGNVKASNLQMQAATMRTQGSIARKSADKVAKARLLSSFGSAASTFGTKYGYGTK